MKHIESLAVKYHQEKVGTLSLSANGKICTFKYDNHWLVKLRHTYGLTHCTEGYNGEHATSVNGTGNPTVEDMIAVGVKNKMKEKTYIPVCRFSALLLGMTELQQPKNT